MRMSPASRPKQPALVTAIAYGRRAYYGSLAVKPVSHGDRRRHRETRQWQTVSIL